MQARFCSVFCCCCLVEDTKLNLGQDSEARFGQDFNLSLVEILTFDSYSEVNA